MNRWKNSRKIKDVLKDALGIADQFLVGNNLVHHFPHGVSCRFLFGQFSIGANVLPRSAGISAGRKERIAPIEKIEY